MLLVGTQGAARGRQQISAGREYKIAFGNLQVVGKSFAQRRNKGERASAKHDGQMECPPSRQGDDGLHGDGVENRGGNVGKGYVTAHQVLNIGL